MPSGGRHTFLTPEEVLEKFHKKWGDTYDYSKFVYTIMKKNVIVICRKHGEFLVTPANHMQKHSNGGCPKCGRVSRIEKQSLTHEEFLKRANTKHSNKGYIYPEKYVSKRKPIKIICPKHGPFMQRAQCHMDGNGCPSCNTPKGEVALRMFLEDANIDFIPQKSFDGCVYKKVLPFDFYLPKYNLCIEYQGEQHFKPVKFFGGEKAFIGRQLKDTIKKDFCAKNGIGYLSIPYTEFKNVKQILASTLGIDAQSSECSTHCQCNSTVESH